MEYGILLLRLVVGLLFVGHGAQKLFGWFGVLGGFEFELTLLTVALAVVATGPERISLDRAFGWDDNLSGIDWTSAVLAAAIVISVVTTTLGRGRPDTGEMGA